MALLPVGKRNAAYYPKICHSHFLQYPLHPAIHCYIIFMAEEATYQESINQNLRSVTVTNNNVVISVQGV